MNLDDILNDVRRIIETGVLTYEYGEKPHDLSSIREFILYGEQKQYVAEYLFSQLNKEYVFISVNGAEPIIPETDKPVILYIPPESAQNLERMRRIARTRRRIFLLVTAVTDRIDGFSYSFNVKWFVNS